MLHREIFRFLLLVQIKVSNFIGKSLKLLPPTLGPLLFIIYLNDFERCFQHSKFNMCADDTEKTISSNIQAELRETVQAGLLNIAEWMRINKLSLNPTKTE